MSRMARAATQLAVAALYVLALFRLG